MFVTRVSVVTSLLVAEWQIMIGREEKVSHVKGRKEVIDVTQTINRGM